MPTKKKMLPTWTRGQFDQVRKEILASTVDSLKERMGKVYSLLTEDERAALSFSSNPMIGTSGQYPERFVRIVLLAVAADLIDREWNAESLRRPVARLRRILKKRPH